MAGAAEVRTNLTDPFAPECIDRVKTARNIDWWSRGAPKAGNVLTAVKDRPVPIDSLFGHARCFPGTAR